LIRRFSFPELEVPDEFRSEYIYESAWNNWQQWMPDDQKESVIVAGRYSVSPHPGLRVIGMNNMFSYVHNW
jgi:sphingomyelin phosphodiesterase